MSLETVDCKLPTRVLRGVGAVDQLGRLARELGAKRIFCVTDAGVVAAGHLERARRSILQAGLELAVFDRVQQNPTTADVDEGLAVAKDEHIDFFVGLGGGSAMDCAKGINFLYSCGGQMKDYWGKGKATGPLYGMIAVPTTAGTGSESQSFALISDAVTHQKMACGDKRAAPKAAILDPELTLTLPRSVTAATGMDAITHAVETCVSTAKNATSRELSHQAWSLLSRNFERVLEAPTDLDARSAMLLGSTVAGAAIEHAMLGAAHAAANPLTAHHGVTHGLAVGQMLPHVVRFNSSAVGEDYRVLLTAGEVDASKDAGERLATLLERFLDAAELPRRLREVGVDSSHFAELSAEADRQWTARFNPRPVAAEDFTKLYREAL